MSCTASGERSYDVRDYFLGELAEPERLQAARHIQGCGECTGELEQLKLMKAALFTLRDEEPPQRIGFVSDKVFEPSPLRRWFGGFWLSSARVGFASAAMLSAALVFSATYRPEAKVVDTKIVASAERDVHSSSLQSSDLQAAVNEAVRKAVAETELRQEKKTRQLLAAAEERHQLSQRELNARVAVSFDMFAKRQGTLRAANMMVAGDTQ